MHQKCEAACQYSTTTNTSCSKTKKICLNLPHLVIRIVYILQYLSKSFKLPRNMFIA